MFISSFKKTFSYLRFLKHNKNKFDYLKGAKNKKIIMVEYFQYFPSTIAFSHYIEVITKKYNVIPVLYDPNLPRSSIKHYLFYLKCFLNPMYYLYKSFGVKKFYISKVTNYLKTKSIKFYKKNLKNMNKYELLNLKINNIYIGDLLYDEYLRSYNRSTIDTKKKDLQKYILNFLESFFYWEEFFNKNKNNINSFIVSHTVYAKGIAPRIAMTKNIKVFCIANQVSTKLDRNNIYKFDDSKYFKKTFKKLSNVEKKKFIKIGEKSIQNRLNGKKDKKLLLDNPTDTKIFTNKNNKKKVFRDNKKVRILVATHCFTDAVHFYGKCLFPDFYEWIDHLGKMSEKLDYDWYIKFHPAQYDNNKKHFEYFEKKYKKLILLPKQTTNSDIFRERVDAVLTVYGSVGHEYPLFNIPVINASTQGPHKNYNFSYYPNSISSYEKLIKNIKTLKVNKNNVKKDISEYVFMAYESNFEILANFQNILFKLGKDYDSSLVFNEYLKSYSKILNDDVNHHIYNFIKSNKIKHYKFDNKY